MQTLVPPFFFVLIFFLFFFFIVIQLGCNDVVLFWRIQKMLQTTSNAIRQQVMNHEGNKLNYYNTSSQK